jgi:DNA replication and repair protein RecF
VNIKHLNTTNFRNIADFRDDFSPELNILHGNNAQGKTNLIEAIYIIGTTKSFRRVEDDNLINFNQDFAKVDAKIVKDNIEKDVSIRFSRGNGKKIILNDKPIPKHSDYIGNVNVTLFCPEDLMIVKGDAANRRRFMDILLCQTDRVYLSDLISFQKILKQRNNLLKEVRESRKTDLLDTWDEQFCLFSCKIIKKRVESMNKISEYAQKCHKRLHLEEILDVKYACSIYGSDDKNPADYEIAFNNKLKRLRNDEINRGYSLLGPHRDDLDIEINQINTRFYGSQGQKRSAAISLRLAEVEYIKLITEEYPILLLDDIFSELDEQRKKDLMRMLQKKQQTFITGTSITEFATMSSEAKIFTVQDGKASS